MGCCLKVKKICHHSNKKKSVLLMHLFQGIALIIPKRPHFHHFTMLASPLPFIFPPFSFFIYNKENSCIINALGKYFLNDRFTLQKWFVFHYRWEVWRNAYFYVQSNKIYFCPTLSNYILYIYSDIVPQRLWEIKSEPLNTMGVFQVPIWQERHWWIAESQFVGKRSCYILSLRND